MARTRNSNTTLNNQGPVPHPPSLNPLYPALENRDPQPPLPKPEAETRQNPTPRAETTVDTSIEDARARVFLAMVVLGIWCNVSLFITQGCLTEYVICNIVVFLYFCASVPPPPASILCPEALLTWKRFAVGFFYGSGKCLIMNFGLWVCMVLAARSFLLVVMPRGDRDAVNEWFDKLSIYLVLIYAMRLASFYNTVYHECENGIKGIFDQPTSLTREQITKNDAFTCFLVLVSTFTHLLVLIYLFLYVSQDEAGLGGHFLTLLITLILGVLLQGSQKKGRENMIISNEMKWLQAMCAAQNEVKERVLKLAHEREMKEMATASV